LSENASMRFVAVKVRPEDLRNQDAGQARRSRSEDSETVDALARIAIVCASQRSCSGLPLGGIEDPSTQLPVRRSVGSLAHSPGAFAIER